MNVYPHHSELERMNQDDNQYMAKFYKEHWKPKDHDIFAFTTTRGGVELLPNKPKGLFYFLQFKPKKLWDYKMIDNVYYIDHHPSN